MATSQMHLWTLSMNPAPQAEETLSNGQAAYLQEQLAIWQKREKALKKANSRLASEKEALQADRRNLEAENAFLQYLLQSARADQGSNAPEALKRELLKIAHPDKWSQGQLATELAHELTVVLTKSPKARQRS